MENSTYEKLFELSHKTKDNLVTPIILYYYQLENLGMNEKGIVKLIENKLTPFNS